ncbi:MAG: tetratricopeptide repeat protein [Anaerolineae bacterium]|nr:tetratricopeptide repeat protein [Anaerolineae bacterium]
MSTMRSTRPDDDEEEYEGLYKSFQGGDVPTPAPPKKGGVFGNILNGIKSRRDAQKKSKAAPPKESGVDLDGPTLVIPPMAAGPQVNPLDRELDRDALLAGLEEPAPKPEEAKAKPPKSKGRKIKKGLSPLQLITLVGMGLLILCVYAALSIIVLRTMPTEEVVAPTAEGGINVITPAGTGIAWTGENISTSTPLPEGQGGVTAEPEAVMLTPTSAPTPLSAVTTKLDLQVHQDPDNLELRIQRGEEYLRLRAYTAAVWDFGHALSLDETRAEAHLGLGKAYFYLRRWDEAEDALSTAVSFKEDLEAPHFWLGMVYYYSGQYEEAAKEFDWAAQLVPTNPQNEAWLALTAAKMNNFEEARGAVGRAMEQDDAYPLTYIASAQMKLMQGDVEGAQGDLLYAKSLEPHNFDVLNALASFYAEHVPERIGEAERLIQQAQAWAEWDIQKAQALHTLGRIYLAQGRKEDAKEVLAQASGLATVDGHVGLPDLVADLDRALAP